MSKEDTAKVLDEMVAGIMGVRANKAATLTPVGTEAAKMPDDVPGVLLAREGLVDIAKDLRDQAAYLIQVADGLDAITGRGSARADLDAKQAETERVLKEREADRRINDQREAEAGNAAAQKRIADQEAFDARMADLASKAQEATYANVAALDDDDDEPAKTGWTCPKHGSEEVMVRTSPRGRVYTVCMVTNCKEFERS